ncbi:MAG: hypothetical protein LBP59_12360 [Planctomycetaceae bacterium]|jgi:hypothetical protein|nr:hypothetical protein [Planctomycetaceae bacterium]
MLQRRLRSNGGYLRLNYFMPNHEIPCLELDTKGILGTFLVSPLWGIERVLYWTVYEKISDDYEIWSLRKNTYSNEDMNKACEYLKALHTVLVCGWSTWGVGLCNTTIFSGFSLIPAGMIIFGGIRRIGVTDLQSTELLQKIDTLTEDYFFKSICGTITN